MGQKQSNKRISVLDVSDPQQVQHTAQLKLDPNQGIVLQVPELDAYLRKEGIPFSDRSTWDVLRFVYYAGGLRLVRDTLALIRARRTPEPAPDYDLTTSEATSSSTTTDSTPSSRRRHNWSSQEEQEQQVVERVSLRQQAIRSSVIRRAKETPSSPEQQRHVNHNDAMSEGGDDWRSARSSVQEITIQWVSPDDQPTEFVRPASKVWKRPMSPEVHADLVRALKARESHELREFEEVETRRTHTILITDPDMNG
ncbi:uncharacterized protein LOC132203555 [Neocloeon triangulifer]|uniref:uncharacterized protein LOC132203555 n=1 Tax=Neocloeon triangulifer TaxID=2078957 RepID=UPI00286F1A6F|nr:uncharacterized protein LOC132203555 [Neocloeon triangulifer]